VTGGAVARRCHRGNAHTSTIPQNRRIANESGDVLSDQVGRRLIQSEQLVFQAFDAFTQLRVLGGRAGLVHVQMVAGLELSGHENGAAPLPNALAAIHVVPALV